MKIRQGFVSNSSSSSFILSLGGVPTDIADVAAVFFPGRNMFEEYIPCPYYDDENISVQDACSSLQEQLAGAKPLSREDLIECFCSRYDLFNKAEESTPRLDRNAPIEEMRKMWRKREALTRRLAEEAADEYLSHPENKGKQLYRVEYHDDHVLGRIMEHSDTLQTCPVPTFRISHH